MAQVKDPVCGMMVDSDNAEAESSYQGKTYYFCSEDCKEKFDANPSQYIKAGSPGMAGQSSGMGTQGQDQTSRAPGTPRTGQGSTSGSGDSDRWSPGGSSSSPRPEKQPGAPKETSRSGGGKGGPGSGKNPGGG